MAGYYVESYLPHGTEAEQWAQLDSFDEAFAWIEERLRENLQRITRFRTGEVITAEQANKLGRYNVERIGDG